MNDSIAIAGFTLDAQRRELRDASGRPVPLRPRPLEVLLHLARNANRLVTKDELMDAVWPNVVVTDDSVVQCIVEIRRALGDESQRIVRTEPRRGYRLLAATPAADAAPSQGNDDAPFEQQIRFATARDGVRIAWALAGEGPPLLSAPHWLTHLDWDWRSAALGPRIRGLARRFRLLRFDERGQGLSDQDVAPGTLDECVADMEAVVDAVGWRRFAMIAASGGGGVAIRYAARHPERVSRLVLLASESRGARVRGVAVEHLDAIERLLLDGWGQENAAFRQLLTTQLWPTATAEQIRSLSQLQRMACGAANAAARVRRRTEFDLTDDLPRVRCPTLVLHSPRDAAVPFEEGRRIARGIAGARLETFDSPNHTPFLGEPAFDHIMRLIAEFLGEADREARPALHAVGSRGRTA
jgi:pimeloyl-ACP methyl ester carboxylesterase/DNA-binding winged helix-turn-helix (wHTH) protein